MSRYICGHRGTWEDGFLVTIQVERRKSSLHPNAYATFRMDTVPRYDSPGPIRLLRRRRLCL